MFIEINGLAYNLMFTQSIDKLYEDGKYKILYAISNENKLVEEFDNEADRDAKYEKAQAVGGASKEEIVHIEDEIEHLKEVGFHPLKVDELPTVDIKDYILYLVPSDKPGEDNLCYEYLYINNAWEMVGTTSVDLSNYYTKDEVDDRSMFNIVLPNSTLEGNGNIGQEDYQAFLPLLQFLYTKCRGTSRFIRLPFVNINTAHDSSTSYDADNSQLFVVNEQYNKSLNNINVSLDGIPKFDESGVAKYFSLYVDGNIENDNITSIRSVSVHKSTLPVATKKYVDDNKYSLPVASADTLGGIKIGENLSIDENGVVSADVNNGIPIFRVEVSSEEGGYAFGSTGILLSDDEKLQIQNIINKGLNEYLIEVYFTKKGVAKQKSYLFHPYHKNPESNPTTIQFNMFVPMYNINASLIETLFTITGNWNNGIFTCTSARIYGNTSYYIATKSSVLTKTNTTSYTPTGDYNPATKKYVDDAITAAITTSLEASY